MGPPRLVPLLLLIAVLLPAGARAQAVGVPPQLAPGGLVDQVAEALEARRWIAPEAGLTEEQLRRALVDFQEANGLAPTGWIDADTAGRLGLDVAPPGAPDETVPGTGSFHLHEEARLLRAADALQAAAGRAGTERARQTLQQQARKAQVVARLHRDEAGALPLPAQPAPSQPRQGAGAAPPAVAEEELARDEVIALQEALQARGLLEATPSGVLDADTRSAIAAWQRRQGRVATGQPDERTLDELIVGGPGEVAAPDLPPDQG